MQTEWKIHGEIEKWQGAVSLEIGGDSLSFGDCAVVHVVVDRIGYVDFYFDFCSKSGRRPRDNSRAERKLLQYEMCAIVSVKTAKIFYKSKNLPSIETPLMANTFRARPIFCLDLFLLQLIVFLPKYIF